LGRLFSFQDLFVATENFECALALTLQFEGGYSDHPADPGGATNMGITRATLTRARGRPVGKAEIMALSRKEAAAIYRRLYWDAVRADELPSGLDIAMFDFAVNSGPAAACKALRSCLGLTEKSATPDRLIEAAKQVDVASTVRALCAQRLSFLHRLKSFRFFGRGWQSRVRGVEEAAGALSAWVESPKR
jgi:lysozyme family protein